MNHFKISTMSKIENIFEKIKNSNRESLNPPAEGLITFLNNFSYLKARENLGTYSDFDRIYCDGFFLCLLIRIIGVECKRVSFDMTSLAPLVFGDAERKRKTVYLVGGEPGVVERANQVLSREFPRILVVGTRHGYFNDNSERMEALKNICSIKPDIVVVGMGAVIQEDFLKSLKTCGWRGAGYTCGGFFHQTAKSGIEYYPKWVDRLNLRWLYRIIDEPKLFKRYFFYYPLSLIMFFYDVSLFSFKSGGK
ncbi:WecB/TagA/CpsF family glycosyltransferase [Halomonas sp. H10-59]|uniref:WecB/TagA/CpsF family glycosyltransferase n=1 Tax=Halomonas sp. H10-59 TaxID=2950874 RepID=A0AAU7L060_9GAMM